MRIYILVSLLLLSFTATAQEDIDLERDKEIILVRKIGHEILKYAGDSSTTIKPIKEISDREYILEFNTEFAFTSDSIISIVDRVVLGQDKKHYLVKVKECVTEELIFSYYYSSKSNTDLESCESRPQKEACYRVFVNFLENEEQALSALWFLLGIPLIGWLVYINSKKPKAAKPSSNTERDGVYVGQYVFDYEGQTLLLNNTKITLTYKESKILKVLTENINDVVERDELQKQVWEEDGIVVGRSLDMFISKLRKKFKEDQNIEIKNIHGIGYKLIAAS